MASASQHKRAERGGKRKKTLSHSSVGDVSTRPKSVQIRGEKKKKKRDNNFHKKMQTERPVTSQIHELVR